MMELTIQSNFVKFQDQAVRIIKAQFYGDVALLAHYIKQGVQEALNMVLGDKTDHFVVKLYGNQYGYTIRVEPKDAIGGYLYFGTAPHLEVGYPLANPDEGFGPFWGMLEHPGQKPLKPEIDAEIRLATQRALLLVAH